MKAVGECAYAHTEGISPLFLPKSLRKSQVKGPPPDETLESLCQRMLHMSKGCYPKDVVQGMLSKRYMSKGCYPRDTCTRMLHMSFAWRGTQGAIFAKNLSGYKTELKAA